MFKKIQRTICVVLTGCLLASPLSAGASELSDAVDKLQSLSEEKDQDETDIEEYNQEIDDIVKDIEELQEQIEAKQKEIDKIQKKVVKAQKDVDAQYADMKVRIKYIYENGDAQMLELIFGAEDFTDFINRIEYVTELSDYDREKLDEFQAVVDELQEQQDKLKAEYDKLADMKQQLSDRQDELEQMVSETEEDISEIEQAIEETNQKIEELGGAATLIISGYLKFEHPCPGYTRYSSGFGPRSAPIAGASTNHKGQDMAAPTGTPIYAAESGTVTASGSSGNAGNRIIIDHGSGLETEYMHCSELYVSAGQRVERGEKIGAVGSTGNSTGPHLHFQVMINGEAVNPLSYLD